MRLVLLASLSLMLLTLSLVQEWLETRNVTLVVAHILDTSVCDGSCCTDSFLTRWGQSRRRQVLPLRHLIQIQSRRRAPELVLCLARLGRRQG